jgi:hypothetical protein
MVRRYIVGKSSTDIGPGDHYIFKLVAETDSAWGVSEGGFADETIWLPKSACSVEGKGQGMISLWVPDWLATKKGIA